jgi:thioredoxin reductase (NADPH)
VYDCPYRDPRGNAGEVDVSVSDPNIEVWPRTEVTGLIGEQKLEGVNLQDNNSGETATIPIRGLFVFIGANPHTEWLGGQLAEDDDGFLLTGADIPASRLEQVGQTPLALETSRPGVFCVGDVRSRSIKRVAAAVGEGSMAVRLIFERLEATGLATANLSRAG